MISGTEVINASLCRYVLYKCFLMTMKMINSTSTSLGDEGEGSITILLGEGGPGCRNKRLSKSVFTLNVSKIEQQPDLAVQG